MHFQRGWQVSDEHKTICRYVSVFKYPPLPQLFNTAGMNGNEVFIPRLILAKMVIKYRPDASQASELNMGVTTEYIHG